MEDTPPAPPLRFVISASEAESMAKKSNLPTVLHLLPSLVPSAQRLARTPISNFNVGAVGLGASSGRIFLGVNVEFPNLPLHYSIHAEQFLLTNLSLNAEPSISHFAVSAAPCGHCRQFYQELRNASSLNLLITNTTTDPDHSSDSPLTFTPLSHFLPHRFGPEDLLSKDLPFLLEPHHNNLSFPTTTTTNGFVINDRLKQAALDAANNLGPTQSALVAFIVNNGGGYENIVAGVLVEMESATVKQEQAARLLLQTISPESDLKVCFCVASKKASSI
uniref:cytidine deaminase n=1 Tax=Fagus sylvatica TaxID=28930 RepID=A0A2N9EPK0_FAGSY